MIVISAGMQKAASASCFKLTNALLLAAGFEDVHSLRQRYGFGFFMSRVNCNVGPLRAYKLAWLSLPHWRCQSLVAKTHEGPSPSARLLVRAGMVRPTYIYRDPRDVAVSLFEHGERLRREGLNSRMLFDQLRTLDEAIQFTARLLPIWRAWTSLPHCLAVRFETFTANMLLEAERPNAHLALGLDRTVLGETVRRLDPKSAAPDELPRSIHLHTGQRGRWESRMTDAHKELCQQVFGAYIALMGY